MTRRKHDEPRERGHAGALLRHWRTLRRVSQLSLALEAEISMRHLSYLETGRAEPSRAMLLHLSEVLQIPLRERNTLLLAAGFAPRYRETGLDAPELSAAQRAIDLILAKHEPFPAVVLDRHWNQINANASARRFLARFPDLDVPGRPNSIRLVFHPHGLRRHIENWEDLASLLVQRVHREASADPSDAGTKALLAELLTYPDVPKRWRTADLERPPSPLFVVNYRHNDRSLRFFSTITTFGTPQDVSIQELRIECFFPADDATRDAMTP